MIAIPTLATERLILRGHKIEDFAAYAEMAADPNWARYTVGTPPTREQSWSRFLRNFGHWALLGQGFWAVEERQTGDYLGDVGFVEGKRDLTPPHTGEPEIGWALKASAQGKGYATEAAQAALLWGRTAFGPVRAVCIINPENTPSLRVAARLGFADFEDLSYQGNTIRRFARML